jgi:uncharacterized protein (TIGR02270 family)
MSACVAAVRDDDDACRFWGPRSAILLGDRTVALQTLLSQTSNVMRHYTTFGLTLQAAASQDVEEFLRPLAKSAAGVRPLIRGAGLSGAAKYVPWLIGHMRHPETARLAAEAFSCISGADLSADGLDRPCPAAADAAPTDDPDDGNVSMDEDEGLPWPDADRVEQWWEEHSTRFQSSASYFAGAPLGTDQCIRVLKRGRQRQRMLSSLYLCLLRPGTSQFNTSAPGWRQRRQLAGLV